MKRLSQTWRQKHKPSETVGGKNCSLTHAMQDGTPRRSRRLAKAKTPNNNHAQDNVLQDITESWDKNTRKSKHSPKCNLYSGSQCSLFNSSFGFEFDADALSAVEKMEKEHLLVEKKSRLAPEISLVNQDCSMGPSSPMLQNSNANDMRSGPKLRTGRANSYQGVESDKSHVGHVKHSYIKRKSFDTRISVDKQVLEGQSCVSKNPGKTRKCVQDKNFVEISYKNGKPTETEIFVDNKGQSFSSKESSQSKTTPQALEKLENGSRDLLPRLQQVSDSTTSRDTSDSLKIPKSQTCRYPNSSHNSLTNAETVDPTSSGHNSGQQSSLKSPANHCQLSSWGLPASILKRYEKLGIKTMFEWQAECLCTGNVLNGGNLVYSAPTSAGKTMVAEILMLKRILELKCKALFILPFVSVAREKMFYLQRMFQEADIKVDGYMGSQAPSQGFSSLDIAVCTIEKANGLVNHLLEEGQLHTVGTIIVDEMHLIGDPSRGYLLELLLTKVLYMTRAPSNNDCPAKGSVQIIGMSATLPNVDVLAKWLGADLFFTDYRPVPLTETLKVGTAIYSRGGSKMRELSPSRMISGDDDHVLLLCQETVEEGNAVLMFCPTKSWCEKLAEIVARHFCNLNKASSNRGRKSGNSGVVGGSSSVALNYEGLKDVFEQLRSCHVGLDSVLSKTLPHGVAYHHAGLTFDERDIIEGAFRQGIIKVLVATSTLSSGVNLPARRVIIRTPIFHGKLMDGLVYKQMSGRAGRKGVDSQGESILICKQAEKQKAASLLQKDLKPVQSCLVVKRSDEDEGNGIRRALLEVIASGVATTPADVQRYASCTFYVSSKVQEEGWSRNNIIESTVEYLASNEFMTLRKEEDGDRKKSCSPERYLPTQLGQATLASSLSPHEALVVFADLNKARKCFVLENELHIIYQVTPIYVQDQWPNLDWFQYLKIWERLPSHMKRVGELVGVEEGFLIRAIRGRVPMRTEAHRRIAAVHKRFYVSLALQDLVHEAPLDVVARKFGASRGMLQSLQSSSATFAGMVTVFCRKLGWVNLAMLLSQFQNRLTFGVERELVDLVRISTLNGFRARLLYNAGYHTLAAVASASPVEIEKHLRKATPFQSTKRAEWESEHDLRRRMRAKCVWVDGRRALTQAEAAQEIVGEAREILKRDVSQLGVELKPESKKFPEDNLESSGNALVESNLAVPRGVSSSCVTREPASEESRTSVDHDKNGSRGTLEKSSTELQATPCFGQTSILKVKKTCEGPKSVPPKSVLPLNPSERQDRNGSKSPRTTLHSAENISVHPHSTMQSEVTISKDSSTTVQNSSKVSGDAATLQPTGCHSLAVNRTSCLTAVVSDWASSSSQNTFEACRSTAGKQGPTTTAPLSPSEKSRNTPDTFRGVSDKSRHTSDNSRTVFDKTHSTSENPRPPIDRPRFMSAPSHMTSENCCNTPDRLPALSDKAHARSDKFPPDLLMSSKGNVLPDGSSVNRDDIKVHSDAVSSCDKSVNVDGVDLRAIAARGDKEAASLKRHSLSDNLAGCSGPKKNMADSCKRIGKESLRGNLHGLLASKAKHQELPTDFDNINNLRAIPKEARPNDAAGKVAQSVSVTITPCKGARKNGESSAISEHSSSTKTTPDDKKHVSAILDESPELFGPEESPEDNRTSENVVYRTPFRDKENQDSRGASVTLNPEHYSEALFPEYESPRTTSHNREGVAKLSESFGFQMSDTSLEKCFEDVIEISGGRRSAEMKDCENEQTRTRSVAPLEKTEGINAPRGNRTEQDINQDHDIDSITAICTPGMFDSEVYYSQGTPSVPDATTSPDIEPVINSSHSDESRLSLASFCLRLSQSFEEATDSDLSTGTLAVVAAIEEQQNAVEDITVEEGSRGPGPIQIDTEMGNETAAAIEAVENEMYDKEETSVGGHSDTESRFTGIKDRSLGFALSQDLPTQNSLAKSHSTPNLHTKFRRQFPLTPSQSPAVSDGLRNDDDDSFTIIDVCESRKLFNTFVEEWKSKSFSFSVAVEKMPTVVSTIGRNFNKGIEPASPSREQENCLLIEEEMLRVVGLAVCWEDRDAYFISLRNPSDKDDVELRRDAHDVPCVAAGLTVPERLDNLGAILGEQHTGRVKTAFGLKEQYKVLSRACGVVLNGRLQDPKVATWLLDPEAKERTFNQLVEHFVPQETNLLRGIEGNVGHASFGLPIHSSISARWRSCVECVLTMKLMDRIKPLLEAESLLHAFAKIEMPVMCCLARMELNGLGFSNNECERIRHVLQAKLRTLEQDAYHMAKRSFSLNTPEDVSRVLFLELKLPPDGNAEGSPCAVKPIRGGKGRKVKYFSTSKDVLEKLSPLHPLPKVVLEWRRMNSALTKVIFPVQKERVFCGPPLNMYRIHPVALTNTATGRVSFSEPNLQNVPKDFDINLPTVISDTPPPLPENVHPPARKKGRKRRRYGTVVLPGGDFIPSSPGPQFSVSMRSAFVPFSNGVLLAADYSQLELRLIAHLSGDEKLLGLLNAGGDVFKMIGGEMFRITQAEVSEEQRQHTKQVCYGIIYGIGAKALGEKLGVDENEAAAFIDSFKSRFAGVRGYLQRTVEECRKLGYVTTVSGRKRYLLNIRASNGVSRAHAERQAVNTTVQGSAADLVKLAMANIDRRLCDEFTTCWQTHRQRADRELGRQSANAVKACDGAVFSGAYLVLQLHDELLFEVAEDDLQQVMSIVKDEMEKAMKLTVKIPVRIKTGRSWGTLAPVEDLVQQSRIG